MIIQHAVLCMSPTLVKLGAFLHWGNRGFWCVLYPWAPNSEQRGLKSTDLSTELCNLKIRFFFFKILIKVIMQLNVYVGNYTHIHQQNDTQQNSCRSLNASHKKVPDYQKKGHWKHESHKNLHQLLFFFSPIKTGVSSLGQVFFPPLDQDPSHGWDTFMDPKQNFDGSGGGHKAAEVTRRFLGFCFFFCVKKKGEHFWSWLI